MSKYKYILPVLLIFFIVNVTGCATNANSNAMTYIPHESKSLKNSDLNQNIAISAVNGGHESLLNSQINNLQFKKALENSLMIAGLETNETKAKYLLNVNLIKLDQPLLGGINLTVTCVINYKLTNKNNKIIYNKDISSTYTAKFSESYSYSERLRLANEGAARENIRLLINDLYRFI